MTLCPQSTSVRRVSAGELRRLFNESEYPALIAQGRLVPQLLRNDHLKEPHKRGEPLCTHGQAVHYCNIAGDWQVEIFQYLRPDGSLGASGRPDPKRVRMGASVCVLETKPEGGQG